MLFCFLARLLQPHVAILMPKYVFPIFNLSIVLDLLVEFAESEFLTVLYLI